MSLILLDTHALHWWSTEPEKLSPAATEAIRRAERLAVAAMSWYELAWLARHGRITLATPIRTWLERLAGRVRTIDATPAIADSAAALPDSFPADPADRLIFATAVEHGAMLITKDRAIREHAHPRPIAIW
ncbi:MAG: type II toxin-antitoxin system VapC family toxin [Solirubrobacterales bacterium]